jgi:hypothetical protein
MVTLRINPSLNRFYAIFEGFCTKEELEVKLQEAKALMQQLQPGFSMISDISTFKPATQEAAELIKQAAMMAAEFKVGRVIRVVGQSQIAAMQLNRVTKDAYSVDMAGSIEEAEKMLEQ